MPPAAALPPHGVPGHSAVVVIDVQNDFCHADGAFARAGYVAPRPEELATTINNLTTAARHAHVPVIWVRTEFESADELGLLGMRSTLLAREGLRIGTWGSRLLDGLHADAADIEITKRRFSAFYRTDLEEHLGRLDARHLYVCGVRTDYCVESTVREAFIRDVAVTVVADATRGYVAHLHGHSLEVMASMFARVIDVDTALQELDGDLTGYIDLPPKH